MHQWQAKVQLSLLQPRANKKPRPEKERPPHFDKYAGYTVSTWQTEEGTAMNRRATDVERAPAVRESARETRESAQETSAQESSQAMVMTDGPMGWRHHWRHGMVGAVQYSGDNLIRGSA